LLSLLAAFAVVAWRTGSASLQRFGVAMAFTLAIFMGADMFFPQAPIYGAVFLLFAFLLVAAAEREASATHAAPHRKP
jgi:hypothetical protein